MDWFSLVFQGTETKDFGETLKNGKIKILYVILKNYADTFAVAALTQCISDLIFGYRRKD